MVAEPDPDRLVAFPCPKCHGRTVVLQTRTRMGFISRRRVCVDKVCGQRVTTHEMMCFEAS